MVEDLRCNYKEYDRKDKTAFRASVFRGNMMNYVLYFTNVGYTIALAFKCF